MTVFGLILFGCLILEVSQDWSSRGRDYVIASQFNYVFKALIYMALIIGVGLYHLMPRASLTMFLAISLTTIGAGLVMSRSRMGLQPFLYLLLPFFLLAHAICNLAEPRSPKSR